MVHYSATSAETHKLPKIPRNHDHQLACMTQKSSRSTTSVSSKGTFFYDSSNQPGGDEKPNLFFVIVPWGLRNPVTNLSLSTWMTHGDCDLCNCQFCSISLLCCCYVVDIKVFSKLLGMIYNSYYISKYLLNCTHKWFIHIEQD